MSLNNSRCFELQFSLKKENYENLHPRIQMDLCWSHKMSTHRLRPSAWLLFVWMDGYIFNYSVSCSFYTQIFCVGVANKTSYKYLVGLQCILLTAAVKDRVVKSFSCFTLSH